MADGFVVRPGRDEDALGLIALVGACFAEYPGCVLDVDGEEPELKAIATSARAWGGAFWVVVDDADEVVGSIGWRPGAEVATIELKKLYIAARARRRGLAGRLCGLVTQAARDRNAHAVVLWTDTRFVDAHRLYERLGFVRLPGERALGDLSDSREYPYRLAITD
ncbi:GNAT family N-acetyltransferase [Marinivivus vitaminiproducens]|uniref:GNAT family N-acetyltransferase n=1 Tax=Marinivivus vitaminiproducens TaxID=3035935 RepID=UPI0027A410EE|nr:GNAT family N-acetyltransferase [Geminicoccaceae bacterium SCSIO 64248]